MGIKKEKLILILILIFAFLLRLVNLNQSLWLDEGINVLAVKNYSLIALITEYAKADFHPPLHFMILWVWGKIFQYSEIYMRLPSVIFGVATVYFTYLIGKKLDSVKLGLLAALILAINPLHIYYSQEARMYSLAAFAAVLNVYCFIKLIRREKYSSLCFFLSLILLLGTDYLTYFLIPTQFIILLLLKEFNILKRWLILSTLGFLAWIWWLPIFTEQIQLGLSTASNVSGWKDVVGGFGIKPLALTYIKFIIGRISHPDNLVYLLMFTPIGLLVGSLIFLSLKWKENKEKVILVSLTLLPILLSWALSIIIPIYSYFRMLFVLPFFILSIGVGILQIKKKYQIATIVLVCLSQIVCTFIYFLNPMFQREDWKGLASFLKEKNKVVVLESTGSFSPFEYYSSGDVKTEKGLINFPAQKMSDISDLNMLDDKVYLLEYLVGISDPNRLVQQRLHELGYKESNSYNFNGVGLLYEYTKQ